MDFFDHSKSIIENITFFVQPLILLAATIGLYQLKIAKDSIKINSMRESAVLSFDLCEKNFEDITSLCNELATAMENLGIDYSKMEGLNLHDLKNVNSDNPNFKEYQKVIKNYDALHYELWCVADKLEAFAIPFIRKIADEELAYNLKFIKFFQYCNLCVAEIIISREANKTQTSIYENVIELYSIWKSRNEKETLQNQAAELLSKSNKITVKKIKPIGT
jgi:hypothetical protein